MTDAEAHELEERLRTAERSIEAINERLKQGNSAFADLRADISNRFGEVKAEVGALKPKPAPILGIIGVTVSVLLAAGGAISANNEKFNARPTHEQVSKLIQQSAPATAELHEIHRTAQAQALIIERLRAEVDFLKGRK